MDVESKTPSHLVLKQLSCLLWKRTLSYVQLSCTLLDLSSYTFVRIYISAFGNCL